MDVVLTLTTGACAGVVAGAPVWPAALALKRVVCVVDVAAIVAFCFSQVDCADFLSGFTCRCCLIIDVCQNKELQQSQLHDFVNQYINYFMVLLLVFVHLPLALLTVGTL